MASICVAEIFTEKEAVRLYRENPYDFFDINNSELGSNEEITCGDYAVKRAWFKGYLEERLASLVNNAKIGQQAGSNGFKIVGVDIFNNLVILQNE